MSDSDANLRKALAAFDWYVHVYAPTFLRLANLDEHAAAVVRLPNIVNLDQSVQVYTSIRDLQRDVHERYKQSPGSVFLMRERVWPLIAQAIGDAQVPTGPIIEDRALAMLGVASEISTLADRAAYIAVANGDLMPDKANETESALGQQLEALLSSTA